VAKTRRPQLTNAARPATYEVEAYNERGEMVPTSIAGFMWLEGVDGSDKIFYTTGRLTSEMVIKCAQMRIPFLVSRSGLTQMGHAIAKKVGITMVGRASGRHYLAFTGRERIVKTASQPTAVA